MLDAGGRDATGCTSLWLVAWGAQSVHGVYPKGSTGGLSHEDLKTYMTQDPDGRKYQVVGDKYNWRCGLAVRDWRGVAAHRQPARGGPGANARARAALWTCRS